MEAPDYYDLLGIPRAASPKDIKSAFRRLAKQYHPDCNRRPDAAARFREIKEAYDCLIDPAQRTRYDERPHAAGSKEQTRHDEGTNGYRERQNERANRRHEDAEPTPPPSWESWDQLIDAQLAKTSDGLITLFEKFELWFCR